MLKRRGWLRVGIKEASVICNWWCCVIMAFHFLDFCVVFLLAFEYISSDTPFSYLQWKHHVAENKRGTNILLYFETRQIEIMKKKQWPNYWSRMLLTHLLLAIIVAFPTFLNWARLLIMVGWDHSYLSRILLCISQFNT